jgi:uncharacterized protein (DUF885 family)
MKTRWPGPWLLLAFLLLFSVRLRADVLDDFASDFWAWRATEQPFSTDDIPRIDRPTDWTPDWSPEAIARYRAQLTEFESRWKKIDASAWPVPRQVDYRLMGSAVARVRWELEILKNWQRNPMFYVDQSLGAYFHLLLPPPPFDAVRSRQIVATLASVPHTLEAARRNLSAPAAPFARLALEALQDVRPNLQKSTSELKPLLDREAAANLDAITEQAIAALESYREWIKASLPAMAQETAVGREGYVFFLKNVALLPYTPEQLLSMGQQEWARAVASQTFEEHRNLDEPEMPVIATMDAQMALEVKDELAMRRFLEEKDLLTVPVWMHHYRYQAMPPYMEPLRGLGETDDFTGPTRLKEDSTRYLLPPSAQGGGYFGRSMVRDPRPLIAHEGVPGHYFQLALSWAHPDPIRRYYYDSSANEGIGFYAEEMLMHAGLLDDSPRSREFVWNFMRLRALRVEVDVKLATGQFSMEQAAEYLEKSVPMDAGTAHGEVALFSTAPGQAISYQIGKLQIYQFLAEARRQKADTFSLRAFHDFLWRNGNLPIVFQRWEYLGLKDQVDVLSQSLSQ